MRQTLLLAGRPVRRSNPPCQDANLNPLLLLSIWLALWPLRTRVTPTCPSLFVCLSSELSAVGPNHTTICPVPGSCPLRHGSSKCYFSVNLSRTTGTPALWHTPALSRRREEGKGESTVRASPSLGVLTALQRAGRRVRGPGFICCRNTEHMWSDTTRTSTPTTLIISWQFNLIYMFSLVGAAFISASFLVVIFLDCMFAIYCSCIDLYLWLLFLMSYWKNFF